ncbi:MAG: enoyl-CoA hydratase/isomerase family protein [Acidimicrobiales bacterium]
MRDFDHIRFERDGRVLVMTLNRPAKRNAVNGAMHAELEQAFRELDSDEESNVVVLTGAGHSFCAGGDISGWVSASGTNLRRRPNEVHDGGRRLVDAVLWVEKPIIAMVRGAAIGLGATLALLCDVVYVADDAQIGDRHVNFAAVAGDGGAAVWPLLVGLNRAKELLMTGRAVRGDEAARIGLVNRAVPTDELDEVTMALAQELAALEPFAVRATKASVNRHLRRAVEDVLDISIAWERLSLTNELHRAAAREFIDRRADASDADPGA